jgi:hypothetical protein
VRKIKEIENEDNRKYFEEIKDKRATNYKAVRTGNRADIRKSDREEWGHRKE